MKNFRLPGLSENRDLKFFVKTRNSLKELKQVTRAVKAIAFEDKIAVANNEVEF